MDNEEWYDLFTHTNVEYLRFMGSDHRSILTNVLVKKFSRNKSFRFDKHLLSKPNFDIVVKEDWLNVKDKSDPTLEDRIKNYRTHIARWRKRDQVNSSEIIDSLKSHLENGQNSDFGYAEEVLVLQEQLRVALVEEESFWRQKVVSFGCRKEIKIQKFTMPLPNNEGRETESHAF